MTEPEELDEDLFADLYEADEPAPSATPATQFKSAPEPIETATLKDVDAPPPNDAPQGVNDGGLHNSADVNQDNFANGQDDRDNSKWDNDGRGSRMDVVAEQDSSSIGIKEDG
ncbi:MAG: hypothetical protein Q9188_006903 [Gyalolechia gomerana]|nr:MAG: hypothetical protein LQ343_007586 [Gyalolechia ehrenbergii]